MDCRLCKSRAELFYTGQLGEYFSCTRCLGVFMSPDSHLSQEGERARYESHTNGEDDASYQAFVAPIVDEIRGSFTTGKKGLDFGCGAGPRAISSMLKKSGYSVEQYDPIFKKDTSVFRHRYDFIACCEVIEHFRHPAREFLKLQALLEPKGKLLCMTELLTAEIDFATWPYKDDPTHIFFYRPKTVKFIQDTFGFGKSTIQDRLVVFENSP